MKTMKNNISPPRPDLPDQFDHNLDEIYAGSGVTEEGYSINQSLTSTGTYSDPVGVTTGNQVLKTDPRVATWPVQPADPSAIGGMTQNFTVGIDGFILNPGVVGRDVSIVPPGTLQIFW